ncbi:MAG: type II toxin-antitoxin system VapC family toxin [Prevotellaceae bacterium]|nr:type II toxin-antitoxin system VapC family toxin [Prevotellaceae bacterium]
MKLYLDTNALIDLFKNKRNFDKGLLDMLSDEANLLYTCPICVHEMIFLHQTGKIVFGKEWKGVDLVQRIMDFPIKITNITPKHLMEEERLPFVGTHHDPVDRLIIAQAISDRTYLVSCDRVFPEYAKYGLDLLFYER